MNEIIDIHCHILPGLDDGSRVMEESVELLNLGWKQGIRGIIATPHYLAENCSYDVARVRELGQLLQEKALKIDSEFYVQVGNEIYYSDSVLGDLTKGKALTLADSQYVLVEFSPMDSYNRIYQGVRTMIMEGYLPILAHFERYKGLWEQPERVAELIELGAYLQLNISGLTGGMFDKQVKRCKAFVLEQQIHFIATDCHRMDYRPPEIKRAMEWLNKHCDEHYLEDLLINNPRHIFEHRIL